MPQNSPKAGRITVLLPPDIKAIIERAAEENGRSMSAEILQRVKATLKSPAKKKAPA